MEPTVFYRKIRTQDDEGYLQRIELYEFIDGEFVFIKFFEFPNGEGCMLDRKIFLSERTGNHSRKALDIIDLEQNSRVHYERFVRVQKFQYLTQNDITYMIITYINGTKHIKMFEFTDLGVPYLVDNHPLRGIKIFAIDRTPNDNRFIITHENEIFTCAIEGGMLVTKYFTDISPEWKFFEEFSRISNVIIPLPSEYKRLMNVYCFQKDFVLIDGNIYCTEYDHTTGRTNFFQMYKRELNCWFYLDSSVVSSFVRDYRSYKELPIIFDWLDNSVILLCPSKTGFKDHVLHSIHKFYESDTEHWINGYVIEEDCILRLHINETELASFEKPDCVLKYCVLFDNQFFIAYCTVKPRKESFFLTKYEVIPVGFIHSMKMVDNVVWFVRNRCILSTMVFCQESGLLIGYEEFVVQESIIELVHNPYSHDQCFLVGEQQCYLVHKKKNAFSIFCIERKKKFSACFIDRGLVIYGDMVYELTSEGIKSVREIPFVEGKLECVKPRLALRFTHLKQFQVQMCILSFDGNIFRSEIINVADFLAQCKVSATFSAFESFRTRK
ncbi:hypothetical protein PCE1_004217 [Barthelona sp. PCE]